MKVIGHDRGHPCPKCGAKALCKDCNVCEKCGYVPKPS